MDRKRIIIGVALGCILILSGCRREVLPDEGGNLIRFSMGAALTSQTEPATKFGDMKEGESFASGDEVLVYGRRNTDDNVFDGVTVTRNDSGWSYAIPQYWNWASSTDYYDFLAVYSPSGVSLQTNYDGASDPLELKVMYNVASAQYDLMLAGKRRNYNDGENRLERVSLNFKHMLCAVKVNVTNGSSARTFILKGYHFENLVVTGTALVTATYDAQGNPAFAWDEKSRLGMSVGGGKVYDSNGKLGQEIGFEDSNKFYYFDGWDLMIPQNHNEKFGSSYPALVVDYTLPGDNPTDIHARVLLKDVLTDAGVPAIPSWEVGKRYCYEITISLDGGVQVRVTTTDWENVAAETPGLLIPPDL